MRPRAMLFDYGGTLDGPASHWLVRFLQLYRAAGVEVTFEQFRDAFDHATACGYADSRVATFDLEALVAFHVGRRLAVPLSAAEFYAGLRRRFTERGEAYFLPGKE